MKKLHLLFVAALLGTSSMSAIVEEDITPKGYDFNNLSEFHYVDKAFTGANLPIPVYQSIGGDAAWKDGACAVAGGQFGNAAQPYFNDLKAGTSLVDLGGEVGKVFCISGMNSKINEKLKELYDVDMNIPKCTGGLNWFNINWLSDPKNTPVSDGKATQIRVRLVLNVFANSLSEANNIVNSAYAVVDQGGINPSGNNTASGNNITTGEFSKRYEDAPDSPEEDENGNLIWDPNRWLVYEFDTWCPEDDETTVFYPIRLKMEIAQPNLGGATIFIKEVKFSKVTENEAPIFGTRAREYKTLKIAPKTSSVAENLIPESHLNYTINGNNVTFNDNAEIFTVSGVKVAEAVAGVSVELAKGFYVATTGAKSVKLVVR